jgi:hypothetical protein
MFLAKGQKPALEWSTIRVGFGLTRKHWSRLERLARDKRSGLLRKFINYGSKSFITLAPGFMLIGFWLIRGKSPTVNVIILYFRIVTYTM